MFCYYIEWEYDHMIDMKKTGRRIKDTCDIQGISVKQIQKELHIGSFQSIYSWFQGKTLPSLDNFYALCRLLCVSMDSMIVVQETSDIIVMTRCMTDNNLRMSVRVQTYVKKYIDIIEIH